MKRGTTGLPKIPQAPIEPKIPGNLRVSEHYACYEGEGCTLGARTWLLRLSGCDLRCWWCDSKHASFRETGTREWAPDAVLRAALDSGAAWLSVTGGEPFWRGAGELKALAALCRGARKAGLKIKVETNGRRFPKAFAPWIDLWSVAPKWDSRFDDARARSERMDYEEAALAAFARNCPAGSLQWKFVVTSKDGVPCAGDLSRISGLIGALPPEARRAPVFLIPEAYAGGAYLDRCRALEDAAAALSRGGLRGCDVRVQPQWHRILWGDARGR
jgi:7-carboxy-7-deazaguanine synthase